MTTIYPEPPGYSVGRGFVKANPKNNAAYLERWKNDPWYDVLVETDRDIEAIMPGYNIAQIKAKFDDLRYYVDYPEGSSEAAKEAVQARIRDAEAACREIEYARKNGW